MANTEKKQAAETKKTEAVKTVESKSAATAAAAPKTEEKNPVQAAAPVVKKAEEKKPAAAPKKTPAKAAKPAEKTTSKAPAKKTAKENKPASKRAAKAPKTSPYDTVIEKAKKKFDSVKTDKVKYPIAVNVELSGSAEGIFYVYLSEAGKPAVEPYKYDDYDVYVRADADAFGKVLDGKLGVYDALADGTIHVDGNVKKALMFFISAF